MQRDTLETHNLHLKFGRPSPSAGLGNVRPASHIRPAKHLNVARELH